MVGSGTFLPHSSFLSPPPLSISFCLPRFASTPSLSHTLPNTLSKPLISRHFRAEFSREIHCSSCARSSLKRSTCSMVCRMAMVPGAQSQKFIDGVQNCNSQGDSIVVSLASDRSMQRQRGIVTICRVSLDSEEEEKTSTEVVGMVETDTNVPARIVKQVALWTMATVYASWLFLLPYAPGDPVWAISPATISGLIDLSLNFFYVLPLANMAGFHLIEAPIAHPTDEALFNFVLGWALLFAPLVFTDRKRDRFTGSLDAFWSISMFLTNTVLIPYMAIRLTPRSSKDSKEKSLCKPTSDGIDDYQTSGLQRAMTSGARGIAVIAGFIGILSLVWALAGRPEGGYGDLVQRWNYFVHTINCDRPSYAFIWDLCCYSVFQPWLIADNLGNVKRENLEAVRILRFIPYVGLVAYCWALRSSKERQS